MQHCNNAASLHCLVEEWKDCEELNSAKKMKIQGKCEGTKVAVRRSQTQAGKAQIIWEDTTLAEKSGSKWRGL